MTDHQLSMSKCLPVERRGARYVVAEDWLRADLPLPDRSELSSFLTSHHRRTKGRVLVGENELPALIYFSDQADEYSFALLDEPTKDKDNSTLPRAAANALERYLIFFQSEYAFSEAVLPEQRCYVPATFVQPTLYSRNERKNVTLGYARDTRRLIVSGTAGAGKTTLLRYLMIQLARSDSNLQQPTIPVFIALRDWRAEDDFASCARRSVTSLNAEWLANNFDELATRGALTFALDGIDEISNDIRPGAVEKLNSFIDRNPECSFVVSSRTGVKTHLASEFVNIELKPFNHAQIREVIYHKLYERRPWKPFWTRLALEPSLLELAGNPLLLTLLLARYIRKELSPHFVTESMSGLTDLLVDEWDAVRGIVRSKNAELSPARKSALLKVLANHLTEQQKQSFTTREVAEKLRRVYLNEAPADTLSLLEQHTSMITKNENDDWSFRHQSIQEFYTCVHWVDRLNSKLEDFIRALMGRPDKSVSRMLRYILGLSSDASEAIKEALNKAPPLKVSIAVALCESMSQRLPLDPTVIDGFARYCKVLLLNFFKQATAVEFHEDEDSKWHLSVIAPKESSSDWSESLSDLLFALYKARDGSAYQALMLAFDDPQNPEVIPIGKLLLCDGRLEVQYHKLKGGFHLIAQVSSESPDLPDGLSELPARQTNVLDLRPSKT